MPDMSAHGRFGLLARTLGDGLDDGLVFIVDGLMRALSWGEPRFWASSMHWRIGPSACSMVEMKKGLRLARAMAMCSARSSSTPVCPQLRAAQRLQAGASGDVLFLRAGAAMPAAPTSTHSRKA
jgi:hypothetical protein